MRRESSRERQPGGRRLFDAASDDDAGSSNSRSPRWAKKIVAEMIAEQLNSMCRGDRRISRDYTSTDAEGARLPVWQSESRAEAAG